MEGNKERKKGKSVVLETISEREMAFTGTSV